MVQAFISPRVANWVLAEEFPEKLREACMEIVPAAFHSDEGPLIPGSIEFIPQGVDKASGLNVDVLLIVEAYNFSDRASSLDDRCKLIQQALKEIFSQYGFSFAVWGTLVCAGWATDSLDEKFNGDMNMDAAVQRARDAIAPADS